MSTTSTASVPTANVTRQLSSLERLPDELLVSIHKHSQNPWMGFVCKQFHATFETRENRQAILDAAFQPFGLPYYRAHIWRNEGLQGYQEFSALFAKTLDLPWVFAACWGNKEDLLIKPDKLKAFCLGAYGGTSLFRQKVWTKNLGRWVAEAIRRWPRILKNGKDMHWHVRKALATALEQGCQPVVRLLSGLDIKAEDCDDDQAYDNDAELPQQTTFIQRWKPENTIAPVLDTINKYYFAPIEVAMIMVHIEPGKCKYPKLTKAYIEKFFESYLTAKQNDGLTLPSTADETQLNARFFGRILDVIHHPSYTADALTARIMSAAVSEYSKVPNMDRHLGDPHHVMPGWYKSFPYARLLDAKGTCHDAQTDLLAKEADASHFATLGQVMENETKERGTAYSEEEASQFSAVYNAHAEARDRTNLARNRAMFAVKMLHVARHVASNHAVEQHRVHSQYPGYWL